MTMIKKILPIILCLILVFSISASAANSTDNTNTETPAASEEMPMQGGGRQGGGGRGGMGMPPGGNAENGEMPAMPDGEMPRGEMTPPDNSGNAENGTTQQPQPSDGATDATNENADHMQRGGMGADMSGMNGGMQENNQKVNEMPETQQQSGILGFVKNYSTPIFSVILLILAFVFVAFYKRKNY